jgi:hypothetical protein
MDSCNGSTGSAAHRSRLLACPTIDDNADEAHVITNARPSLGIGRLRECPAGAWLQRNAVQLGVLIDPKKTDGDGLGENALLALVTTVTRAGGRFGYK